MASCTAYPYIFSTPSLILYSEVLLSEQRSRLAVGVPEGRPRPEPHPRPRHQTRHQTQPRPPRPRPRPQQGPQQQGQQRGPPHPGRLGYWRRALRSALSARR
eukprot:scaffold49156_cov60-Phaeocystis_antarctica.AAC.3